MTENELMKLATFDSLLARTERDATELAALKAENERLREAIETVLPHFESHQVYDKGTEGILRQALEEPK